jgi:hypothetical protein
VAKADILRRENGGWYVLEVKSSFSDDTGELPELIADLAYGVLVFRRAGFPVTKASLVLLSEDYRFGGGPDRLFDIVDATADVLTRATGFEAAADSVAAALVRDAPPAPVLVPACRDCPYFEDRCLGAGLAHTVLEIPGLHAKKLKRLSDDGIIDLACIPDDLSLNNRQQRAIDAMISGRVAIHPALGFALSMISWPCHYLDFETVATVLPLYEGHGCHQQVLTQFSVHHRDAIDTKYRRSEYLADASRDCQRELAEALIAALGTDGSIIVYSGFEKTRIKALRAAFPDLKGPLGAILDRLVDLLAFVSDYVYHPDFK